MFKELVEFWKNITNYSGRCRRREFWVPCLWCTAVMYVLIGIGYAALMQCLNFATGDFDAKPVPLIIACTFLFLGCVLGVGVFLAQISAGVRRCHDIGYPGYVYALCILGSFICGIGGIVWLIVCCIDSKDDNQWGPNPKVAEPDKYPGSASIVGAIVAFIVSIIVYLILIFAGMFPAMISQMRTQESPLDRVGDTDYSDTFDEDIDDILKDITEDFPEEETEEITEEITEDTSLTEDMTTEEVDSVGDSSDGTYYEPNAYTDKYVIKIGNMNLNVDFDGGCTVYDNDGTVRVYREYTDSIYCDLTFSDSYVEVGNQDNLISSYATEIDGYTMTASDTTKAMDAEGNILVSYGSHKSETDNSVYCSGTIWQNIGADRYLQIDFVTNATDDIQAIVDSSVIALN